MIPSVSSSRRKGNGHGYDENHPAYQLSAFFVERIEAEVLSGRKLTPTPNLQVWSNHTRLLMEVDGKTEEDIRRVMEWVVTDDFWKSNVLSTDKLRKKFATLFIKMTQSGSRLGGKVSEKTQRTIENLKDWSPPQ